LAFALKLARPAVFAFRPNIVEFQKPTTLVQKNVATLHRGIIRCVDENCNWLARTARAGHA
jgi:hypothetical protein